MVWWKRLTKILRRGKRDKRKEGLGGGGANERERGEENERELSEAEKSTERLRERKG